MASWLIKRDGTRSFGFRNPDGSWVELPKPDDPGPVATAPAQSDHVPLASPSAPGNVHEFLRDIGRRGGQARAARHSRDEMAAWGRMRRKTK